MKHLLFITFCLLASLTTMAQAQSKANEMFLKAQELDVQHNYSEAVKLYEQAKVEIVKENRKDSTIYANCYTNIGRCYYVLKDYKKAAEAFEVSLPRYEKFSDRWGKVVEWLGFCYEELKDSKNKLRIMALIQENNEHELTLPCDEPKCMTERAQYYEVKGDHAKAKEFYQKAIDMLSSNKGDAKELNEQKVKTYEAYGKFLGDNMRDFASGAEYYILAANAQKAIDGVSEDYASLMFSAGIYSYLGKQYQQAIDCYNNVLPFYKNKTTDAAKNNIAKLYMNMGNTYSGLKDYVKAAECHKKNLERQQEIGTATENYAKALERVATAEKFTKQYDSAIEHYKQSLAMYQQLGKADKASSVASSLNLCYAYAGKSERVETSDEQTMAEREHKLKDIIKQETNDLELTRKYLGELTYANSLATIAGCYNGLEKFDSAVVYYERYLESLRKAVRQEFSFESETERMYTWTEAKGNLEEILEMMASLPVGQEALMPWVAALAYDVELLGKGILLKSSIAFETILKNSGNKTLVADYSIVKKTNDEIKRLRTTASTDAALENILHKQRENDKLLLSVIKGCPELSSYTNYLSYTWKDVQKAMEPTDVAIEFGAVNYDVFDKDNFMTAIVLTKDMTQPTAFPVCNLQEAKLMMQDSLLFDRPEANNLIWGGTLKKYIDGKKRIFFAADGSFNNVAIEYLQFNGTPLSEQFEVYRLSSTKELCYRHKANNIDRVAMFGNIDYYEEPTSNATIKNNKPKVRGRFEIKRGADNGKFITLENSKAEIEGIDKIFTNANLKNISMYSGTEASESAFLKLTDSDVNILHIATHGTADTNKKSTDADAMNKCALAFAGANLYEESDSINGLVTAAQVSKMNIRNCDLTVLSACESGLGKISDDGVFGLQRGFKNAGVHTLLMSLKPVYDDSTKDLMIAFYRNLMSGASKREALVEAQKEIKSQYKKGKFWAPFIMLDAY